MRMEFGEGEFFMILFPLINNSARFMVDHGRVLPQHHTEMAAKKKA